MYEAHEVMAGFLFGGLGLYLVVFWGSALISYIVGDYLNDGDVEVWSLPKQLAEKLDEEEGRVLVFQGILLPVICAVLASVVVSASIGIGWVVPWFFASILGVWLVLYTLRWVIRLNKRLVKHENDENAHKGSE